ncbi:hypothetical protein KAT36_04370 [Candidatus Pacearchaeota archaeon]|nr:hypothetical protein [Candidatus Pacearchaeota archaeon]
MKKLNLGLLGIYEEVKRDFSKEDLTCLTTKTLEMHPLGKILKISGIEIKKISPAQDYSQEEERAESFRKRYDSDIVAIIKNEVWLHHDKKTGLIYSDINPINLSHEIGHRLGLSHPKFDCGQFCDRYYAEKKCKFSREIMGCAGALGETTGFSNSDAEILKNYVQNENKLGI